MKLYPAVLDAIAAPAFVERPALIWGVLLVIGLIVVTVLVIRNERK